MRETMKKAASGTAIPKTAAEMGTILPDGHPSASHNTMRGRSGQLLSVAKLLSYGPENGITLLELEALTGTDGRTIRKLIQQERLAGSLIISDNQNGYFLAETIQEAEQFARSMIRRAGQIRRSAEAIITAVQTEDRRG